MRLLNLGWQKFILNNPTEQDSNDSVPLLKLRNAGRGTLADFLGFSVKNNSSYERKVSALPFLAYHRIYDSWYRVSDIQTPVFLEPTAGASTSNEPKYAPYVNQNNSEYAYNAALNDSVWLTSLRQRNYAKDYFTTATVKPQAGDEASVKFDVAEEEEGQLKGSFTIASLRAANSLQKWCERNNIAGERYADRIHVQYGCLPSDALTDRPLYLGRSVSNVYNKSVMQTSQQSSIVNGYNADDEEVLVDSRFNSKNPFYNTVGAKAGASSMSVGNGTLVDSFTATEHGYLMVLASIVPHAYYGTGSRRYLEHKTITDFAFPLLSSVGDDVIKSSELLGSSPATDNPFGYCQRYAHYKFHNDEVHGSLCDGEELSPFALKRSFRTVGLNTQFLQIPVTALDEVLALNVEDDDGPVNVGGWSDIYFDFKMSRPLPAYSIPTLGDEKDTHTQLADKGGRRL